MFGPPQRRGHGGVAWAQLAFATFSIISAACTRDVNLLGPRLGPSGGGPGGSAGAGAGGQSGQRGDASVDGAPSCLAGGEPLRLLSAGVATCASTLAARTHRFVLCSCGDWNVSARVFTDSLSSRPGMVANPISAAIGVNGNLTTAGPAADISARGSLYVGGAKGIVARGHLEVYRSLMNAGALNLMTVVASNVWGEAYVGGDISGPLSIAGTLHLGPTATVGPAVNSAVTTRQAIVVPPPCPCGATVDVAGAIAGAMANNDNAAAGIGVDRLVGVTAPVAVDVPCGVYALSGISAEGSVTLAVHGRAMLAVAGDIVIGGGLFVVIDPGVSLDLVLGGALVSMGPSPVGSTAGAVFRLWVNGPGPIVFEDKPVVGATIYAPAAALSAPRGLDFYGSIVAGSVVLGDEAALHFDEAVLSAGCGDPKVETVP